MSLPKTTNEVVLEIARKGGGPVQHLSVVNEFGHTLLIDGMTKREHFAGLAMAALLQVEGDRAYGRETELMRRAVLYADNLIEGLEK